MPRALFANAIFPAFATPYASMCAAPLSWLGALCIEWTTLWFFNRRRNLDDLLRVVLVANLASFIVGFLVSGLLPTGLDVSSGEPRVGRDWHRLVVASFAVAYAVSILVELAVVRLVRKRWPVSRPATCAVLANTFSYSLLGIIALFTW
ncbi:MAG: hypothetical protein HY908_26235 [Myxococcales bacterium]|nr:hypothetical protein [Myxococcales bacterium]